MQQCGNAAEKVWGVSTKDEDEGSDAQSIDEMSGGLQKLTDGGVEENNDKGESGQERIMNSTRFLFRRGLGYLAPPGTNPPRSPCSG